MLLSAHVTTMFQQTRKTELLNYNKPEGAGKHVRANTLTSIYDDYCYFELGEA